MFSCEDNSVEPLVCDEDLTNVDDVCTLVCDEGLTDVDGVCTLVCDEGLTDVDGVCVPSDEKIINNHLLDSILVGKWRLLFSFKP